MKKVLVLGGGVGQLDFIRFCLSKKYEVHIFDGSETSSSRSIQDLNIFHHIVDIKNSDVALQKAELIKPDCVIAPSNDAGIVSAARIAQHLNLPGPGVYAAELSRDKYRLRELTREAGILSPWFEKIDMGIDSTIQVNNMVSFPCVVKPISGSGSRGVLYVSEKNQFVNSLQKSCQDSGTNQILVEEFVPGIEYSLEGIVQNGRLNALGVCRKTRSELPYLLDVEVKYPSDLPEKLLNESFILARKITTILQVQDAPIHMEFIVTPDSRIYLVECAVRAAGFDLFSKLISWCIGVDTSSLQLDLVLGKSLDTTSSQIQRAGILKFPQVRNEGIITNIEYDTSILQESQDNYVKVVLLKKIGDFVRPPQSGSDRVAYFLIFGSDSQELMDINDQLNFRVEVS